MPDRPLDTITDALENPEITGAFRKFLKSEFSDENLEFHERIKQLNNDAQNPSVSDQQLKTSAREIYDRFISTDSPRQVNVSAGQLSKVEGAMRGIGGASREQVGSMMNEADGEIVKLMNRDSLKRFQRTEDFAKSKQQTNGYLDDVAKLEQLQQRERQLKLNPSLGDKAKAMVTSGGMVTMIRDVERQKEALQEKINSRVIETPTYGQGNAAPSFGTRAVAPPPPVPLELEAGTVGRGRSDASDGLSGPPKTSVRDSLGGKDVAKVGQQKSLSVSEKDASKMSVKDKIKLFEGAPQNVSGPKRGVK